MTWGRATRWSRVGVLVQTRRTWGRRENEAQKSNELGASVQARASTKSLMIEVARATRGHQPPLAMDGSGSAAHALAPAAALPATGSVRGAPVFPFSAVR